jgi:hypothetical protein
MIWNYWLQRGRLVVSASIGILRLHFELSVVRNRLRQTYGSNWVAGHFEKLNHFRMLECDAAIIRRAWSIGLLDESNSIERRAKMLLRLLGRADNKTIQFRTHAGQLYAQAALAKIAKRNELGNAILMVSDLGSSPSGGLKGNLQASLGSLVDHSSHLAPSLVQKLKAQRMKLRHDLATRSVHQDLEFRASELFAIPKSVLAIAKP